MYKNRHLSISTELRKYLISLKVEPNLKSVIEVITHYRDNDYINDEIFNKIFGNYDIITEHPDGYLKVNSKIVIKLGRLITKIAKGFNIKLSKKEFEQIEYITNNYKSWFNLLNGDLSFKILKGEKILDAYNKNNFSSIGWGSMLYNSCMNNKFNLLDLYVKNSDKINILVLFDSDEKILGRALLWNLDIPKNTIFMDRVYAAKDHINDMFYTYAIKNKYMFREKSNSGGFTIIKNPTENGILENISQDIYLNVKLNINKKKFKPPYIDTLCYWNCWSNSLGNKIGKNGKFKKLNNLYGYIDSVSTYKLFGFDF